MADSIFGVYSFSEVEFTLNLPAKGIISIAGSGMGTITLSNDGERSTKQLSADGSVLINKIRDRSGTLSIEFLQMSPMHNQLIDWFNYLETAASSEWAKMTGTLSSKSTGEKHELKGVCFVKIANKSYSVQGQNVQWSFLVADIQNSKYS
jgi:hypothetical protein